METLKKIPHLLIYSWQVCHWFKGVYSMTGDYGAAAKFLFPSWRGEICPNGRGWETAYKKCICRIHRPTLHLHSPDLQRGHVPNLAYQVL